jgi:hypothetical protein
MIIMLRSTARSAELMSETVTEHSRDVRLLVALGELDRLVEVVLLEELGELGGELARLALRLAQAPPLLDHDRHGEERHGEKGEHDPLREPAHRVVESDQRDIHGREAPEVLLITGVTSRAARRI